MGQNNKSNTTFKKVTFALIGLIVMAGVYGGIIALCNRNLRENNFENPFSKAALIFVLIFGFYQIYKWFCRRLDKISESK